MTREERHKILNLPFNVLWEQLWGPITDGANPYRQEKEASNQKLEALRANDLKAIIDSCEQTWATPEWGFPKGRRDIHESEYMCALREMKEETGLTEADVIPIKNLDTIRETFFGSNRVQYCHKYFMVYVPPAVAHSVAMVPESVNKDMAREVGDIRWFSLEGALERIRPLHVEKRNVLLRADAFLKRMMTILLGCAPV
jgi:8-oxo-dGTP pyrophosphatase MutT (NUDIX family)